MTKKKIALIVLLSVTFALVSTGLGLHYLLNRPGPADNVIVRIPEGLDARRIGLLLEEKNIIRNSKHFHFALKISDNGHLRAGLYEIPAGSSLLETIALLKGGPTAVLRVTIPEGSASWEIAALLEERDLCPAEDFLAVVREEEIEGFLFPDTYLVPSDFSAAAIAQLFTRNFEKKWKPEWDKRAGELGYDQREIITLASIIEREAGNRFEKRMVSSVFHNRLRRNMLLQACPTVLYAVGSWQEPVTYSLLRTDSPYNTYLNAGLPPGPIANPGREAIEAALYPALTDYLFFVSNRDGSHVFSRTYREHSLAARQIRERLSMGNEENDTSEDSE